MADYRTIKAEPLTNAIRAIVKAGGSSDREAELVSTNLVEANLKGHDSHGVGMIPRYVQSVVNGGLAVACVSSASPTRTISAASGTGRSNASTTDWCRSTSST